MDTSILGDWLEGHETCRPRLKAHGTEMLLRDAAVLIAWQHQDIPGISQSILTQTRPLLGTFNIPKTWPTDRRGAARYDLVFVFDRPAGDGPIEKFSLGQILLAGDAPAP
jgi:hypothetical protein